VSYEIPLPTPDQLQRKPITSSADLLKYLEERGFKPTAVVVDNANAKVLVFFESELDEDSKEDLFEAVMEYYKKHLSGK
jgi:hypothetical protein